MARVSGPCPLRAVRRPAKNAAAPAATTPAPTAVSVVFRVLTAVQVAEAAARGACSFAVAAFPPVDDLDVRAAVGTVPTPEAPPAAVEVEVFALVFCLAMESG